MLEQPPKQLAARSLPAHSHFAFRSVDVRSGSAEKARDILQKIYALRYDVYCLEYAYLCAEDYPQGLESDEYDACSTHFVAAASDNELAGAVRLIQPGNGQAFPFETHCKNLYENFIPLPQNECGEVSRLIVHKHFRRRPKDTHEGVSREFLASKAPLTLVNDQPSSGERRGNSPEILLGLYRQMYHHSLDADIRYWYAAMERSLARVLKGLNFTFKPIGLESEYYGVVRPYVADLREVEQNLIAHNPDLLAWFRQNESHH